MKYLPAVFKPDVDARTYRGLQLDNGLKVLLISDPETDISAASLSVHVGAFADPKDLNGLAHFNQHMLVMGSKKYPIENEYHQYISQNGGTWDASTSHTETVYHFDISPDHLAPTLNRFSRLFINPFLDPSSISREMEAIHSEYQEKKEQDDRREFHLLKSLCDPDHDYAKFSTGNLETLRDVPASKGVNIREELRKFNEQYYSSNIMCLAVCGKESLDELESLVVPMFTPVTNRQLTCKVWDNPFHPSHLMKQVNVVPISDKRTMTFRFNFPDDTALYKCSPGRYLSHLIGFRGEGSLYSGLKAQGLISSLHSGNSSIDGFGFFIISAELTKKGLEECNELAKTVFQYITFLKAIGPQKRVFKELKDSFKFAFKPKSQPRDAVRILSSRLHYCPTKDLISVGYLLDDFNAEEITRHLKYLSIENCLIIMVSKTFEGQTDRKEHFYGIDFKVLPFSHELIKLINSSDLNPQHFLPKRFCDKPIKLINTTGLNPQHTLSEPNSLIPTDFRILSETKDESKKIPARILKNPVRQVWYLQDSIYLEPKVVFGIHLINPVSLSGPHAANCHTLFSLVFGDALAKYLHEASLAGLHFNLTETDVGFYLNFSGYSHKMAQFVEQVIRRLVAFEIDPKRFDVQNERFQRLIKSYKTFHLNSLVSHYKNILMEELTVPYDDRVSSIIFSTSSAVQKYWTEFVKQLDVDVLVYGNIAQSGAKKLVKIFDDQFLDKFGTKALPVDVSRRGKVVQLPVSSSHLFETVNKIQETKAILCHYQVGNQPELKPILMTIGQLLKEPFFSHLRAKEQLGYSVSAGYTEKCGVHGMTFFVQSQFGTAYLERRIEAFIGHAHQYIEGMSEEEFETEKASLITKLLTKEKTLHEFAAALKHQIVQRQYDFDYKDQLAENIKALKKDEVLKVFDENLGKDAAGRRKITVRINRDKPEENLMEPTEEAKEGILPEVTFKNPVSITDPESFKSNLSFYPVPEPKNWD